MYFKFSCDHCGSSLKVKEELAGRKARCPHCKSSVVVPQPQTSDFTLAGGVASPQEPPALDSGLADAGGLARSAGGAEGASQQAGTHSEGAETPGTNVSILLSMLIGLFMTVTWYVAVAMPFSDYYFGELFLSRGWVPYAETMFFFWGLAQIGLKWRKLRRQKDSMLFDLLPYELGLDITTANLGKFTAHVRELPVNSSDSFLINRVLRGMEHFGIRKSVSEAATALSTQSDIDANGVASSYTMLKFFIWAIPILGFIGTVIGIGAAVAGFGGALDNTADVKGLMDSLKDVTGGLGTAFDTTLVALVMGLILKFITDPLQQREDDLLNWVDEYCNENLLKRLNDDEAGVGTMGDNAMLIQKAINASFVPHHAEIKAWSEKLNAIGETLTDKLSKGWEEIQTDLQHKQSESLALLNEAIAGVASQQGESLEQINAIQGKMAQLQDNQATHLQAEQKQSTDNLAQVLEQVVQRVDQTMGQLREKSEAAQTQMASALTETTESVRTYFSALETGLQGLNGVLEKLGQQQVVIEAKIEAPKKKKKGWFS